MRACRALVPRARGDRGRGRDLAPQLRELLCDIRREHPSVSVKVILTEGHHPMRPPPAVAMAINLSARNAIIQAARAHDG